MLAPRTVVFGGNLITRLTLGLGALRVRCLGQASSRVTMRTAATLQIAPANPSSMQV